MITDAAHISAYKQDPTKADDTGSDAATALLVGELLVQFNTAVGSVDDQQDLMSSITVTTGVTLHTQSRSVEFVPAATSQGSTPTKAGGIVTVLLGTLALSLSAAGTITIFPINAAGTITGTVNAMATKASLNPVNGTVSTTATVSVATSVGTATVDPMSGMVVVEIGTLAASARTTSQIQVVPTVAGSTVTTTVSMIGAMRTEDVPLAPVDRVGCLASPSAPLAPRVRQR
jgi:hypothetical protein